MLDAKHFSAQKRKRYFWGNIPGMFNPPEGKTARSPVLKDALMGTRTAQVIMIFQSFEEK